LTAADAGAVTPRRAAVLLLPVGAALLQGCGGSDPPEAAPFTVVGTEMAFDAPERVSEGRTMVTFRNEGIQYHELAFERPDGEAVARRSIAGGDEAVMEVTLERGAWELTCREPGHYEAGMHRALLVDP
jgi:uncharacterized cupredoxin-like copper-binding protein